MTDVTITTEVPAGNTQEARTLDGTLKDQSPKPTTTITPKPENPTPTDSAGTSFLTGAKTGEAEAEGEGKGKAKEGEAPKPEITTGAPDKYTDFTLPDGFKFDDKALTEAQTVFKELNLSQASAQKLVDTYSKQVLAATSAPYDLWANTQREWNTEILSRFGGEAGSNKLRGDINAVINRVLPPTLQKSFRAALDFTGAGSNPDMLEAFSIMLKPHMEGRPVPSGNPSAPANTDPTRPSGPIDPAAAMYPHLVKNRPQ